MKKIIVFLLFIASCAMIGLEEDEDTTTTTSAPSGDSGGDTGGTTGGGSTGGSSACTPASTSFEIVAGETTGQDWEGFVHVVDNSSQDGSLIQSFSVNGSSDVDCSDCQESALHSVRLRTPAELISDNSTLWNGLTTASGTHLIHFYADGRGHPDNLNYTPYSHRAELSTNRTDDRFSNGDERYYSTKVWLPSLVWDDNASYMKYTAVISQWKQYGNSPIFTIKLDNENNYKLYTQSHNDIGVSKTEIATLTPNNWLKLKYYWKFSEGTDGIFQIYLNGTKIYDYSGKTMNASSTDGYWKFGNYTQIRSEKHVLYDDIKISPDLRCQTMAEWIAE